MQNTVVMPFKSLLLTAWLLTSTINCDAQNMIEFIPYNSSNVGWYGSMQYGRSMNKNLIFKIGITYHYNQLISPDRQPSEYFRKRFHAYRYSDYIGGIVTINRHIYNYDSTIFISLFYELTVRNIGTRSINYFQQYEYPSPSDSTVILTVHKKVETQLKDLWTYENILGLNVRAKLHKRYYFVSSIGIGTNIITNIPPHIKIHGTAINISTKYNIGIGVSF